MNILILGGTGEARALAERLVSLGHAVTTSLAGRTAEPSPVAGELRVGGFGGAAALAQYLIENRVERLADATHPFAAAISANAATAAAQARVPLVRLTRLPWPVLPGWHDVPDLASAVAAPPDGASVFLTTGHKGLELIATRPDCRFLVRLIEPPATALPAHAELLIARPPFSLPEETALMRAHRITHLIAKNSGGEQTRAKLDAAMGLGAIVIMIARPPLPPAVEADTVEAALHALHLSPPR